MRAALAGLFGGVLIAVAACGGGDAGDTNPPPTSEPPIAANAQRAHVDASGGELKYFDNALIVSVPAHAVTESTYVDVEPIPDPGVDTDAWRTIDGTAYRVTFGSGTLAAPATVTVAIPGDRIGATASARMHAQLVQPSDTCTLMYNVSVWDPVSKSWKASTVAAVPIYIVNGASTETTGSIDLSASSFWVCDTRQNGIPAANVALRILHQPQSQSVATGTTVALTVDVAGTAPAAYQWRRNGTNIAGAVTRQLTLSNVQAADTGNYQVKVGNIAGSVTSTTAVLNVVAVTTPLAIASAPANVSASVGGQAPFTVGVSGGQAPYNFQWQRGGVDLVDATGSIDGARTAQLTLANLTLADDGAQIAVIVTDSSGSQVSAQALLTVTAASSPLGITAQPQAGSAVVGEKITYTLTMVGTPPLKVEWGYSDTCQSILTWPTLNGVPQGADYAATAVQSSAVSPATFQFTTPPLVAADNGMCWGAHVRDASVAGNSEGLQTTPAKATVTQLTTTTSAQVSLPLALRADGTVWLLPGTDLSNLYHGLATGNWRLDYGVGLGINSPIDTDTGRLTAPRQVAVAPAVAIASGGYSGGVLDGSSVLRSDGSVWRFGHTDTLHASYMPLPGIDQVSAIARGDSYMLLLRKGEVYAYGYSDTVMGGGLGLGLTENVSVPTQIAGLPSTIRAISASGDTSMALDGSGDVWVWGSGAAVMQRPNGTFVQQTTPRHLGGLTGASAIAAVRGSMVILKAGAVYLAGSNIAGLPGATCEGAVGTCLLTTPVAEPHLTANIASIAGSAGLYARTTSGLVYAWGSRNTNGELGTGAAAISTNYTVPALIQGLTGVEGLGVGGINTGAAWLANGRVFVWGLNTAHYIDVGAAADSNLTEATSIPGFDIR